MMVNLFSYCFPWLLVASLMTTPCTGNSQTIQIPATFDWNNIPENYAGKTLVITHHHKVNRTQINLPSNSTLLFKGGTLSGFISLRGDSITMIAPPTPVFPPNASFECSFRHTYAYPEWFGAKGDNLANDAEALQTAIENFPVVIFTANYFISGKKIKITKPCKLQGQKNASIRGDNRNETGFVAKNSLTVENLRFSNFRFCFLFDHDRTIENIHFADNHFSGIEKPLYASNNNLKQKLMYVCITDNTFQNCTSGVELLSWLKHVTLCNNSFTDLGDTSLQAQANAVRLGNTSMPYHTDTAMGDFSIDGNTIRNVYCGIHHQGPEGYECHAVFVVGNRISIKNNVIENVYNGGSSNRPRIKTGSEGIYAKANHCVVRDNTLINAGFGEGAICFKGFNHDIRIMDNSIRYTSDLADQSQLITCYFAGDLKISGNIMESVTSNTTGIKLCNSPSVPSSALISENDWGPLDGYALKIINRRQDTHYQVIHNKKISITGDILKEESIQPYQLSFHHNSLEITNGLFLPSTKLNQLIFSENQVTTRGTGKINTLFNQAVVRNNTFFIHSSSPDNPVFFAYPTASYQQNKTNIKGNWREEIFFVKE